MLLAIGSLAPGLAPSVAAAGDPYESTSTYTVDPDASQVEVALDLVPAGARLVLDGPGEDHLFHVAAEQVHAWVADDAEGLSVTLGTAPLAWTGENASADDAYGYHQILIRVPAYQARSIRHVSVAYTLPGGAIRDSEPTRVLADFAHVCVRGNGPLDGSVVIEAPAGFELDPLDTSHRFSNASSGSALKLASQPLGDPSGFGACVNLVNPALDDVSSVVTGGGTVTVRAWPGDSAWRTRVTAALENAVPALVGLIGRPVPGIANLTVREAVIPSGYEGQYWSAHDQIVLSEDITDDTITDGSVTVAHELAHAWFNAKTDNAAWIYEGMAEWAARAAITGAQPCAAPSTAGADTLRSWTYLPEEPSKAQLQSVLDQYDTACAVVTLVADAAGVARTRIAIGALMDGRDPYGASKPVHRSTISWRDWLDAMDELGIAPNGGSDSLAGSLLVKYGVASETDLEDRLAARRAYHSLIRKAAPWTVPTAVRDPLSAWQFSDAQTAIATASEAFDAVAQADRMVPGSNASGGPIRVQWESAQTQADLDAVLTLAKAQRSAAKDVADAMAPLLSPLGFVPWVGQLGETSSTLAAAKAAVGADNPAAAEAAAIALRGELAHYEAVGAQRLAIAAIIVFNLAVVLCLLVAAFVARRRARRQAALPPALAPAASFAAPLAPVTLREVAPSLGNGPGAPTLPPAPPDWYASMHVRADGPPPAPRLVDAKPLLPPVRTPPPGLSTTTSPGGGAVTRGDVSTAASDAPGSPVEGLGEAPPPPAAP